MRGQKWRRSQLESQSRVCMEHMRNRPQSKQRKRKMYLLQVVHKGKPGGPAVIVGPSHHILSRSPQTPPSAAAPRGQFLPRYSSQQCATHLNTRLKYCRRNSSSTHCAAARMESQPLVTFTRVRCIKAMAICQRARRQVGGVRVES